MLGESVEVAQNLLKAFLDGGNFGVAEGFLEEGAVGACRLQAGIGQAGVAQVGAGEVGAFQDGALQIGAAQVSFGQAGAAQLGAP